MSLVDRQKEYVLRTVEERGVRLVRLWFTDVLGQLKSFAISPAELENAFEEGMRFDGSAIDGFSRIQESDVLARPDARTFELLPWAERDETSARMFCDLTQLDGTPFAGDPRQVLRRNLDAARERGYSFFVAPEIEFFYFDSGDPTKPLVPLDTLSPMARGFYAENRRIANGKAKRVLGWRPRYADYRFGLRALNAITSPTPVSPAPAAASGDQR